MPAADSAEPFGTKPAAKEAYVPMPLTPIQCTALLCPGRSVGPDTVLGRALPGASASLARRWEAAGAPTRCPRRPSLAVPRGVTLRDQPALGLSPVPGSAPFQSRPACGKDGHPARACGVAAPHGWRFILYTWPWR